jgi:hypothetical protein
MQGWRHQIWLPLKTMRKRPQLDRDVDDETDFHLSRSESKIARPDSRPKKHVMPRIASSGTPCA